MKINFLIVTFLSIFTLTSCTTIDSIKPSSDIIKTSPDTLRSTNSGPVIGIEGEEGIHTVSYTHLTLPTRIFV